MQGYARLCKGGGGVGLVLSDKFKDFLSVDADREYLEGTTAAGKTTVGVFKWMVKVSASHTRDHLIAGLDIGTVEKNIINADNGLLELWGVLATYYPNGKDKIRLPHVQFETQNGVKIIYIVGYNDVAKWKKVLGGQVGCVYIDEVNICDMEFLREVTHRCEYMMTTSNPDAPDLLVYKEFINRSRPLPRFERDYPAELLQELDEPAVDGWVHWYFTFYDNAALTKEQIQRKIDAVPVGTKMYKNKIEGLRGRATGLVFNLQKSNIITEQQAHSFVYTHFSIGVDTSYSKKSHDKITLNAIGITTDRRCVLLYNDTYNNKDRTRPFAPSDVIPLMVDFAERLKEQYGFSRYVYIDSADAGTITEAEKYKSGTGCIYDFMPAWKKTKIVTRLQLQNSWMQSGDFLIVDTCKDFISECNTYSWDDKKPNEPEDAHDHSINGCQYAWLPYKKLIGDPAKIAEVIKDAYKD